ncbi:TRAF2 and NCK-interacting protein kinase-like [Zingiber officinale]|uniref:TRAF2 and NCK-interacting protein kinase-like n=1 Tax=Zingiber officinale TaxID=94328 RepID=UPI001C4C34C6|nr:TRAF2 and NCK-interacting protein kinase-like [Zingiber officinale]
MGKGWRNGLTERRKRCTTVFLPTLLPSATAGSHGLFHDSTSTKTKTRPKPKLSRRDTPQKTLAAPTSLLSFSTLPPRLPSCPSRSESSPRVKRTPDLSPLLLLSCRSAARREPPDLSPSSSPGASPSRSESSPLLPHEEASPAASPSRSALSSSLLDGIPVFMIVGKKLILKLNKYSSALHRSYLSKEEAFRAFNSYKEKQHGFFAPTVQKCSSSTLGSTLHPQVLVKK